jgi:hypothetical protein
LVFTDGSSEDVAGVGRGAGCGIFSHLDVSLSAFVPMCFRQTNNTAELSSVIRALQIFSLRQDRHLYGQSVCVCGGNWSCQGMETQRLDRRLWTSLQCLTVGNSHRSYRSHSGVVKFIKVPSHLPHHPCASTALSTHGTRLTVVFLTFSVLVQGRGDIDILGNIEADCLADQGRLSYPRCPVLPTPKTSPSQECHSLPIKKRKPLSLVDLNDVAPSLQFSPPRQ